jgi:DNA-directed RNA polymerase II subunit RPB2
VRTYIYDKLGAGSMPYGHNLIMAIMSFQGYNQDDGIIFNEDAFQRGQFRSINYRSYTTFEEVDPLTQSTSTIAHPSKVPRWTDLRPGIDYSFLDDRGIIKEGSVVNENTVLVGKYVQDKKGNIKDASLTPQVWTSGRVESVVITVNPKGFSTVKVRITQDRIPEFGDKFSTRHGQKGTIGMIYRAQDMPRTADGVVPDMIVNPHCIPSRMTIAQLMEMLFGWVCYKSSTIGDATTFTSDSNAHEHIGKILEEQYGMERGGNTILYDGATGVQMKTNIFTGPVFVMRLKHMVEDKWNARAEGRKEQKTRQPTGGRGAQGGLRIGEMERDALISHGVSGFLKESMMERADKTQIRICNGCGTVPIYNAKQSLFVCPLCDGPPRFIGTTTNTLEVLPTMERSSATTSIVEMPYATKLLGDELQTYLNMGMRILTAKGVAHLEQDVFTLPEGDMVRQALEKPLPQAILVDTRVPKYDESAPPVKVEDAEEDLWYRESSNIAQPERNESDSRPYYPKCERFLGG